MSSRNGRRHRKKTDDEPDLKSSPRKEEKVKIVEPAPIVCIPQVDEKIAEKLDKLEAKKPATPVPVENDTQTDAQETITITEVETVEVSAENVNGNNGNCEGYEQEVETEIELQLVDTEIPPSEPELDTEEQELQKLADDNSDIDSLKSSPVLTDRCATRRSQTRNIPTPKTPRVHDHEEEKDQPIEQNGKLEDHKEEQEEDVVCVTPAREESPVTMTLLIEEESHTVPDGEVGEVKLPSEKEHNLSCASTLSTHVNVGSDVTREIDLSVPDESSFLNTAKDLTVVETLRRMSSRRAIRSSAADYRKTLLKSQAEKHEYVLQQQRAVVEPRVAATKRKTRSKTPDNPKRFKTEPSPGFFSYISSPMTMLRNRFGSRESMSASTPKLTAYREQEDIQDPELSKIEDTSKTPADKKRCVIM